jgi:C4-dicarboxylate transporter DctQ subunit
MLNTIFKAIEYVVERMTFFLFLAMVIALFSQVVLRFFFDFSLSWTAEFSRFAMVWIVFLGASLGMKDGAHTQIDFFINRLPSGVKRCVQIFNKVLCVGFLVLISYYIIDAMSYTMGTSSPAMRIPMGLMHIILPISGVLMITYLVLDIYRLVRNKPLFTEIN